MDMGKLREFRAWLFERWKYAYDRDPFGDGPSDREAGEASGKSDAFEDAIDEFDRLFPEAAPEPKGGK
jgi:hypothetical protein